MNIVNKLTIRHLKQNKRRTLVTIIGVIISVAMVTAVATLGFSFGINEEAKYLYKWRMACPI